MKHPKLDADRARALFDYDPVTGILTWKVRKGNAKPGQTAGTPNDRGYLLVTVDQVIYTAHRLAWLITSGEWPEHLIDHKNGIRSDNRISNLRDKPSLFNSQNQRRAHSDSKTGFLGVSPSGRRFLAQISSDGVVKCLGYFPTPEGAHEAYLAAKRQLHAGCSI